MYSILGFLSSFLLFILLLPYFLRLLNSKMIKSDQIKKIIKMLKKIHRPAGMLLAVVALVHGYLALGSLRLHTGTLLYVLMFITMAFGAAFYAKKKKQWLSLHRALALGTIVLLAVHYFFPSAVYYLLK